MKKLASIITILALFFSLTITAFAAEIAPSAELKAAPTVLPDAEGFIATVHDSTSAVVWKVSSGDLIVTPVATAEVAEDTAMAQKLEEAYRVIVTAGSLTQVCPNLTQVMANIQGNTSVDDLVVRDVFDVSVYGDTADYLAVEGNYVQVTFDLGLNPGDFFVALHYGDTGWTALDSSNVKQNANGTVTIRFYELSPVAFLVDSNTYKAADVTSPQTSSNAGNFWLVCAGLFGVLAIALLVVYLTRFRTITQ